MLVTRIIFLSFQNDESLQLFTYCHSEKAENLASSVDFRLIQNLSMLIFFITIFCLILTGYLYNENTINQQLDYLKTEIEETIVILKKAK